MGMPELGVKLMVVSTHAPSRVAARLEPEPRCAITTRPRAAEAPPTRASSSSWYWYDSPWNP